MDPDIPLTTEDVPDEIRRGILVDAEPEAVWALVAEPGWYINDGTYREHEITVGEDGVATVVDPVHGSFQIGTELLDPPRRAVFRWLGGDAGELADFPANTIEFTLDPQDGGGVLLTVRETGFAGLTEDAALRRRRFEENSAGWEQELEVARAVLAARSA